MRDLISSAVRSALTNNSLEDEAERFNTQVRLSLTDTETVWLLFIELSEPPENQPD